MMWEKLLTGPPEANYTGVLFHAETGGDFAAVDPKTGRILWAASMTVGGPRP